MTTFIIEREIPGASTLSAEELASIAAKSNEVVAGLKVPYTWLHNYVAGDKIYCVHEAEDAEAVREHARRDGFPANAVVEVTSLIGPQAASMAQHREPASPPERGCRLIATVFVRVERAGQLSSSNIGW